MKKIVLLTSDSLRHKYLANQLAKSFYITLIVTEKKSKKIEDTTALSEEDSIFVSSHFNKRFHSEKLFFRDFFFPLESRHLVINHKEINSEHIFKEIYKEKPDRIILFGTSIIKGSILSQFNGKIINLHLGLSPYYKGSATNLFPIVYNEFSCVGATIHIATAKVDQGAILHQLRPQIDQFDNLHDIGNKVIKEAGEVLPFVVKKHIEDATIGVIQKSEGKIFRIKDLTVVLLKKAYDNIAKGMVKDYIRVKEVLDLEYPIINLK